ncbi:MAG: sulfate permease [Cyclobacteriaceae bacterium]
MKRQYRGLPILGWLGDYRPETLKSDLFAGLIVGVMLIPQGMAYALIVGVPPVYGLYAAIFPQLVYAVLGTSRRLSVAPVATDSLIVASGVGAIAVSGSDDFLSMTILLAGMVGVIQILLGLFKMGFITNLLSKPVITGFTAAAAFIIAFSQMKHLFGMESLSQESLAETIRNVFADPGRLNWLPILFGLTGILIIVTAKKISKKIPGPLIAVILSISAVYIFKIYEGQIDILRDIPEGLPGFSLPQFSMEKAGSLLPLALTLSLISYMESFSIAKLMEFQKKDHKINPNQELIALGSANLVGSLFRSFPTAGGFSRSAVNNQAGAKTPMASVISALLIVMTLLFLTPVFYYLPKAILASIILVSVVSLVDVVYIKKLFYDSKTEFIILIATFLVTIGFSMVVGIAVGVALSVLFLLYKSAYPHIVQLGRVYGHHEFRNVRRFKELEIWDNIMIVRLDASLSFINIQYFRDYLDTEITKKGNQVDTIILDGGPISFIDASAVNGLKDLLDSLKAREIKFLVCDLIGPVRDTIYRSGLIDFIGEENIFFDLNETIRYSTTNNPGRYKEYALQSNIKPEG